jgi:hypothetical protein
MATLAIAGLGAAAGYGLTAGTAYAATGIAIGWSVGSYLGSVLFPTQLPDSEGPRVTDLGAGNSAYGIPRTRIFGTVGVTGNMIWSDGLTEIRNEQEVESGGKGGSGSSQNVISYTYTVSCAWALCEGPIDGVRRIWFDSELVYDRRDTNAGISMKEGVGLRIYLGTDSQNPDPIIEALEGVGDTPAYRGTCYIVVQDLQLADYGNRRPNVRAEVVRTVTPAGQAYEFQDLTTNIIRYDANLAWTLTADYTADEVYVYDTYSGSLINQFPAPLDGISQGFQPIGMWNGYIYMDGTAAGFSNTIMIGVDATTGEQVFEYNFGSVIGLTKEYFWPGDRFIIQSGSIADDRVNVWEQQPDGTLDLLYTTTPIGDGSLVYQVCEEPDTGYVWVKYLGIPGTELTLQLIKIDLDPEYPLLTPIKYSFDVQTLDLTNAFDSNGDPASPPGTGVAADNFGRSQNYMAYDPMTQSVIIESGSSSGFLPYGYYRLECTTRHDLTTMRIAASLVTGTEPNVDTPGVCNRKANMSNPLRGDGIALILNCVDGRELVEINTTDMTYIKTHTWASGTLGGGLIAGGVGDWNGGFLLTSVVVAAEYKIVWDRMEAPGNTLDAVVQDICLNHNLAATEIDVTDLATKTVKGFAITRPTKARSQIEILMGAYLFDAVESDKKLKFSLKDKTSVVTIPEDDLAAREPGKRLPDDLVLKRKELYQIPETVQVVHLSREMEYEPSNQYARQPTSPTSDVLKLEFPLVLADDEAAQIAEQWLQSLRAERHSGSIALGPYYFEYDPTDIITVNRNNIAYQFRVNKTAWGGLPGIIRADVTSYDVGAYSSSAVGAAPIGYNLSSLNTAPITAFFMINSPPLRDTDDDGGFYIAMAPYVDPGNWPGAVLQRRVANNDQSTWSVIADTKNRAKVGAEGTGTILPAGPNASTWDWVNSFNVRMWNSDALASDAEIDVLNGRNVLYFPNTGELMQFQVATLEGDGTYTLTGLLRGRRGTEWAMDDHNANEPVVVLEMDTIYKVDDVLANVDVSYTFGPVTIGSNLERTRKTNWTQTGGLVTPLSPVSLSAERQATGDLQLDWIRRARLNAEWLDNVDVPLDEPTEEYDVELYQDSVLLRTERVIGQSSYVYNTADQSADTGGDLIGQFNFCVAQVSSRVGRGHLACLASYVEPAATNFDEYIVGEQPGNWIAERSGSQSWITRLDTGTDLYLEAENFSATYPMLRWQRVHPERDVEVVFKIRSTLDSTTNVNGENSVIGVILRSPGSGDDSGIVAGFWGDTGTATVTEWDGAGGNPSNYTIIHNHGSKKLTTDAWWWCRIKLQGDDLAVKWWADGGAEPAAWDFETTQTSFPNAGRHMLAAGYWSWQIQEYGFFGIAYNGATAPSTA